MSRAIILFTDSLINNYVTGQVKVSFIRNYIKLAEELSPHRNWSTDKRPQNNSKNQKAHNKINK